MKKLLWLFTGELGRCVFAGGVILIGALLSKFWECGEWVVYAGSVYFGVLVLRFCVYAWFINPFK